MANLSTVYAGLRLRNPIIVSSSSLTGSVDGIRKAADNGAGAVVVKSLFEEQIASAADKARSAGGAGHAEADDYLQRMGMHVGSGEYLALVKQAKQAVDIPVVASINCLGAEWWGEFSRQLQDSGADGLELNIAFLPTDPRQESAEIEKRVFAIVEQVAATCKLPLTVKIGAQFTNIAGMCHGLARRGAKGIVLFNRFYQVDINLDSLQLKPGVVFSGPQDYYPSLRWVSLLHGEVKADLAAATGVHDASAALRCLLAGAGAVQICSTVYRNGYAVIKQILQDMETWMKAHGVARAADLRGRLSQSASESPWEHERLQYIKALTGIN